MNKKTIDLKIKLLQVGIKQKDVARVILKNLVLNITN